MNAEKLLKLLRKAGFHLATDSKTTLIEWLERQPAETPLLVLLDMIARTNPVWMAEIEYWLMVSVNDITASQYATRISTAEHKRSGTIRAAWSEYAQAIADPLEHVLAVLEVEWKQT